MNEIPISDLNESLQYDDPTIHFVSNCGCEFKWSFDPDTVEIICDIDHKSCYQLNLLETHSQLILRSMLSIDGNTKDVYFKSGILRKDIPDELYSRVHMNSLDEVRKKHTIKHDLRFKESLSDWLRTSGFYVDAVDNDLLVICKFHQPAVAPEYKRNSWARDMMHLISMGANISSKTLFLDFTQFDEKFQVFQEQVLFRLTDGDSSIVSDPFTSKEDADNAVAYMKRTGMTLDGWYFTVVQNMVGEFMIHGQEPESIIDLSFASLPEAYDYLIDHKDE